MNEDMLPSTATGRKSYKSLKHLIKTQIKEGQLQAHQRLPGMRTLCSTYTISLATVQRALAELCDESVLYSQKGRGTFVAPIHKESRHIGILCGCSLARITGSMFQPILWGIRERAKNEGKQVSVFQAKIKNNGQFSYYDIQDIIRHEIDVLVLINISNLGLIASLKQLAIPIIATDLDATDIGVHSVYFDNEVSAFDMTRRLIDDGHKEIWFVGGLDPSNSRFDLSRRQRNTGWRLACHAFGVEAKVDIPLRDYGAALALKESIESKLQDHPLPTAVVAEDGFTVARVFGELQIPIDLATWAGERTSDRLLTQARYLAPCSFNDIGDLSYALLKEIDEGLELNMARVVVSSQIVANPR